MPYLHTPAVCARARARVCLFVFVCVRARMCAYVRLCIRMRVSVCVRGGGEVLGCQAEPLDNYWNDTFMSKAAY